MLEPEAMVPCSCQLPWSMLNFLADALEDATANWVISTKAALKGDVSLSKDCCSFSKLGGWGGGAAGGAGRGQGSKKEACLSRFRVRGCFNWVDLHEQEMHQSD